MGKQTNNNTNKRKDINRQAGKQTDGQTDRRTNTQTHIQHNNRAYGQTVKHTRRLHAYLKQTTNIQPGDQANGHRNKQTNMHANRQVRKTHIKQTYDQNKKGETRKQ